MKSEPESASMHDVDDGRTTVKKKYQQMSSNHAWIPPGKDLKEEQERPWNRNYKDETVRRPRVRDCAAWHMQRVGAFVWA